MKKLVIVLMLLLPIILPLKVNGYYCTNSELATLKKIASNVNVSYDYKINKEQAYFDVTLTNLNKDLYIYDVTNDKQYNYKNKELIIKNYNSGNIKYEVYVANGDCKGKVLKTIILNLPYYNKYYNDPVCNDVKGYSLCQKWSKNNLSYEEFLKKVELYKKSLIKEEETIIVEELKPTLLNKIFDFLINYYYIILIVIIITSLGVIYVVNKRSNIYR